MDRVAAWSLANEQTLAPTTAHIVLLALNQICRFAVRRGWLLDNPVAKLEAAEKPHWRPRAVATLEGEQLTGLLAYAGTGRPLLEFLAYTGLRIGEALGLTWADVDYDASVIHVHRQLSRKRVHAPLKTDAGKRDMNLPPALIKLLRERWLASPYKAPEDFVFCNTVGRGLDYRKVGEHFRATVKRAGLTAPGRLSLNSSDFVTCNSLGRGLDYRKVGEHFRATVKRAGLTAPGKLTLHSLRHGYASMLISDGLNVVYVSGQLGHADSSVTLGTYAHQWGQADHAKAARDALQARYEAMTGTAAQ